MGKSALIGVIDGLGHGRHALSAAMAARRYVETHYDQPFSSIFSGVDGACRSTRGVVMSLARFDWGPDSSINMIFSGVGNVEAHITGGQETVNLTVLRGILGAGAPSPPVTELPWRPEYVMVLHSDGIPACRKWADLPELREKSVESAAYGILQRLAGREDDATVIVARVRMARVARGLR